MIELNHAPSIGQLWGLLYNWPWAHPVDELVFVQRTGHVFEPSGLCFSSVDARGVNLMLHVIFSMTRRRFQVVARLPGVSHPRSDEVCNWEIKALFQVR